MTEADTIPEEFKGPFGGIDEQAVTDALEDMIGINRSFALMRLWQASRNDRERFRKAADRDGFPSKAVEHYLKYIV
tara:strand:- start:11191 stop:11418 length:228 start_codon:yes stop_codon:yes gene_type:complete